VLTWTVKKLKVFPMQLTPFGCSNQRLSTTS